MKPGALDYLRCIHCSNSVALEPGYDTSGDGTEIVTGALKCNGCGVSYAITRGVPRMVDAAVSTAADLTSGEAFGHAWRAFPRIDKRYYRQFFDWISPVTPEFVKGKTVLDCGCGKGRHINVMAEAGAEVIIGVDIGGAIDVAYENVGHLPNVHIVQGDVANLPIAPVADFAYSLGVLDHMLSPAAGLASMAKRIHDKGSIAIWVYGAENNGWITTFINPFRLAVTSRLSPGPLKMVSGTMATPVYLWSHFVVRPWKSLQKSVPLPSLFYQDYMLYISDFDFTEIHHITHDHLVAPVANYSSQNEVRSWFEGAGLPAPILRWHNRNSWAAFSSRDPEVLQAMKDRSAAVEATKE
ncbi:MAG: methyltransferase domain-containing protein [Candidatus Obscuribacterales bacterium]|nr:methyltransferase domain-containing protein [Candidatus Obscuribacterales bacterium]